MSETSPAQLLEEIRDGLDSSVWSQAVKAVRRGDVALFSHVGERWIFDVAMGRPLPFRVDLDLEGADWSCSCISREDACVHVVAAAIALHRGDRSPQAQVGPAEPPGPHVRHRLEAAGDRWSLRSSVVDGDQERPLSGLPEAGVACSPGDREILVFPGWAQSGAQRHLPQVPAARLSHLLQALALCSDVVVGDLSVAVNADPMTPVLCIDDHPEGLLVRLGPAGRHHLTLPGIPELVVVGEPATLRPLGRSPLGHEAADRYRRGRIIRHAQVPAFLSDSLPRLRSRTPVEMRASGAPRAVNLRPYALLRLTEVDDGVDAMATVTYGRPPQAVVVGGKIHLLGEAQGLPQRVLSEERRLGIMIEETLGVSPGRRRRLSGFDAARFLSEVAPVFEGEIHGKELVGRLRVREVALQPRWDVDGDGQPRLRFMVGGEGEEASGRSVLDAWREGRPVVRLLEGGYARLPSDWMNTWGPLLESLLEARGEREAIYKAVAQAQLLEAAEGLADLDQVRKAAQARLEVPEAALPSGLVAELRPYQRYGFSWLKHLASEGLGAILADDMGLGKTLQALTLIVDAERTGPTLVVAPTSVIRNWISEAERFTPALLTRLYHGADRSLQGLSPGELVVTTYALLRRDVEALGAVRWQRVLLDEAQAIKNPTSQVSRAARQLDADHRLALTGTPIENRLAELWSLLDFVNPGILGGRKGFEDRYGALEGAGRDEAVRRLRVRVRPFILRRLKGEVARDLPPKTEVVLRCPLSTEERRLYDALRISSQEEVRRLSDAGPSGRRGFQILELLLRLRQACCHPGLVPGSGELAAKPSSKVRLLVKQLEVVLDEGHKALVFSQWTSLLDLIEPALKKAGIAWVRLDGSTRDRAAVVDRFQDEQGPGVFLISLKAGGTGLNLTAADYVYLMDPWWNPAVEAQAIDRTYRIGQGRPVVATRIVAAETIEERVLALQDAKRALTEAALGGDAAWLEGLSATELESLLID